MINLKEDKTEIVEARDTDNEYATNAILSFILMITLVP